MTTPIPEPLIHLIQTSAALAPLAEKWAALPWLAIDTEFFRETTFYAQPGLVQVCDGEASYLIEPVAVEGCAAFHELLANEHIVKLMHAPSEDLDLFRSWLKVDAAAVYDTQIAAALCGHRYSMGYAACIEAVLGLPLDKEQTRSDWIARPLTPEQIRYAALDVHYLPYVYQHFQAHLAPLNLAHAVIAEGNELRSEDSPQAQPETYYLSIRGAWKLSVLQQRVLAELCRWREIESRARNRARGHVIKDPILIDIARLSPATMAALSATQLLPPPVLRRHGETLLDIIAKVAGGGESCFSVPVAPPASPQEQTVFKEIKRDADAVAEHLHMPSELFTRRRLLEPTVAFLLGQRPDWPSAWRGWRRELGGDLLGKWIKARMGDAAYQQYLVQLGEGA